MIDVGVRVRLARARLGLRQSRIRQCMEHRPKWRVLGDVTDTSHDASKLIDQVGGLLAGEIHFAVSFVFSAARPSRRHKSIILHPSLARVFRRFPSFSNCPRKTPDFFT
jgi:hypothetical protein